MNHLFLIGINKYAEPKHTQLNNCVKDVQDFRDILYEKYDFSPSRTYEIYDEDATSRKIQDAFGGYIKSLDKNSNLIIYFSGHGWYDEKTERGFWVPYDATTDYSTFIANEVLLGLIQKINAKHIFLIADCCFSWSILVRDLQKITNEYSDNPSRWALTSGKNITWDSIVKGENSIFGESLIKCLANAKEDLRAGKLIEMVKAEIGSNPRQTPQGFPLLDSNNKGGEFIFKIINHEDLNEKIKGIKSVSTILRTIIKDKNLKEHSIVEDKSLKIGFQLFEESSESRYGSRKHYYLSLYEGINQTRTYEKIKALNLEFKYNSEKQIQNLTILLPKEKRQTTDLRKTNVNNLFKPTTIYFIDEFLREECNPVKESNSYDEGKYLIPNFVLPKFEVDGVKLENKNFIRDWLLSENEPVLVVKGAGGIGKTTFSQFIANEFLGLNKNSNVLFIDSLETKQELLKREKNHEKIDIYKFYEASQVSNGERFETLSEDLFRLNLDAGNLLLIIDGIDEVISKVPFFDVDDFLKSIADYSSDIGNTKVIISCRSYFWEASKFKSKQITIVDLLPFSIKQATSFFEKAFENEKRKLEKGLKLTEEFKFPDESGNFYFHPYVLDVIKTIVESENEVTEFSSTFTSNILNPRVKSDYIIHQICYRERYYKDKIRILPLEVDEQLKFFSFWSIKRRGNINSENFGREMQAALGKFIDTTTIEAFKSHPFVHVNKTVISFKYDFFADYFKCIYVSEFIKLDSESKVIEDDFIKILVENCWYGSGMIKDIVYRLSSWSDDEILKCSDLIVQILEKETLDISNKRKATAGLFNICLEANIKFKSNNIELNTYLLNSLFGSGNVINGLHIQNMHDTEETIRFNFSDLILKNCYIENYNSFWNCKFNENTFFIDSFLLGIGLDSNKRIPLTKEHFQNCVKDESFDNAYNSEAVTIEKTDEQIRRNLTAFFALFHKRGKLSPQNYEERHGDFDPLINKYSKMSFKVFSLKEILTYLEEKQVIKWDKIDSKKAKVIIISSSYEKEILSLLKDGTPSKKINDLIIGLRDIFSTS